MLYKIIKNGNISISNNTINITDPKLKRIVKYQEDLREEISQTKSDLGEKQEYNLEEIEESIRDSIYLEIDEERDNILNQAKIEGDKIKLDARKQGYKSGYKEGYELGCLEGIKKAEEEGQVIKNNALSLIQESERYVKEYLQENKSRIIQLSVDMAESIVHHTIDRSSENILMIIKPILQNSKERDSVIISCHPDSYPYVKAGLDELKEIHSNTRIILLEDGNLEKNGCIIENEHQLIDIQIKKQLESILEEIKSLG